FYRDDVSTIGPQPVVKGSEIDRDIEGQVVILCDDVLYTGRTVRAALDELGDYGRPSAVRLAVLVDRGHRELPIHADVIGKTLPTARSELVAVGFEQTDGADFVRLLEKVGAT
ncbi:MAG: bifunctional pyr operon transcriptional regulator/uracil phosphoribosyltransferase PyrR, partial [Acidobacteriota bacterium]